MVHIIDDYYAEPNNLGFTVIEKKQVKKKDSDELKEVTSTVGYCGNLQEVCWLVTRARTNEKCSERDMELKEVIAIMKQTKNMIMKALEVEQ